MGRRFFLLILGLTLVGVVTASAAMLSVDGGVLQVFANDVDLAPTSATIKITPQSLNAASSNGQPSVTVKVEFRGGLPSHCQPDSIGPARMTVKGQEAPSISSVPHPNDPNSRMVKFVRSDVLSLLTGHPEGPVTLVVEGIINNCLFSGEDTISYKLKGGGPPSNVAQGVPRESLEPPVDEFPEQKQIDEHQDIQDNSENIKQEAPATAPEPADPPTDEPAIIGEEEDAVDDPVTADPPGNETDTTNEDELVKEPVKTDPAANEPVTFTVDEPVADSAKPEPKVDTPSIVEEAEPAKVDPPEDEADTDEHGVPVKEPLETDPPADEDEIVEEEEPVIDPVDEPESVDEDETVTVPIPASPQVGQPEKAEGRAPGYELVIPDRPVIDTEDVEEEAPVVESETPDPVVEEPDVIEEETPVVEPVTPDPMVDEPEDEPEPPVANAPPEVVEEQPVEEVELCPIDAEVKIAPEELDINGEVDEALLTVRFPDDVSGTHAVADVTLVEVRVKLGENQYGTVMVEAKPDALVPRDGEFKLTLEEVVRLLEGRLGEVTLEVRGALNGCEFAGDDKIKVLATPIVEEPDEPAVEEPEEAPNETGEGEPVQPEPVQGVQEETEPTEEVELEQSETTEGGEDEQAEPAEDSEQEPAAPAQEEEQVETQTVEDTEQQVGVLEPEEGEEEPDETE